MFRAELPKVVEIGLPILGRQAAEKEKFKEAQTAVVREEICMTKFELVSSILNNTNADDLRENCIYWLQGDKTATVNFLQGSRYASRLRKMKEKYPDDVKIFEDNDRVILGAVPVKAVKISIREGREFTEEEKAKLAERMRNIRRSSDNATISDFDPDFED